jgi:hypothetical protein
MYYTHNQILTDDVETFATLLQSWCDIFAPSEMLKVIDSGEKKRKLFFLSLKKVNSVLRHRL